MQTALPPSPNGHAAVPPVAARRPVRTMSGRRAILLVLLMMAVFGLVVAGLVVSRQWRQTERLVAAGLRSPRGVALMPDDGLVVAEAGLPDAAGPRDRSTRPIGTARLTWIAEDSRGTLYDGLPGEYSGARDQVSGLAALAPLPDTRILVLIGACGAPGCRALHALDRGGHLTRLADLEGGDPWGLAVAADGGAAFVSDEATGAIWRIGLDGGAATPTTLASLGPDASPRGLALGPDGALYAALFGAGRVVRIGMDGAVTPVADGFDQPIGLGWEPTGTLLVLEHATGRLLRLDPRSPARRTTITQGLDAPTSLLVARDGRAWVTTPTALFQIRRLGPPPPRTYV
ncbi:MAG TPA: ScyD/ScyE family protein [Chloroflexota bacterium]|nr:ScyD/ScyE family protein [Chloroflexota bacterium]